LAGRVSTKVADINDDFDGAREEADLDDDPGDLSTSLVLSISLFCRF
jgi:hypothetical protein